MSTSLLETFRELYREHGLKATLTVIKEDTVKLSKEVFKEKFSEIFEKYPQMESVSWQACQHYNDESYYYNSSHDEPTIDEAGMTPSDKKSATQEVEDFLGAFSSDDMLLLFGEDVQVTVTRSGTETKAYYGNY